jgi:hypothetical protein
MIEYLAEFANMQRLMEKYLKKLGRPIIYIWH